MQPAEAAHQSRRQRSQRPNGPRSLVVAAGKRQAVEAPEAPEGTLSRGGCRARAGAASCHEADLAVATVSTRTDRFAFGSGPPQAPPRTRPGYFTMTANTWPKPLGSRHASVTSLPTNSGPPPLVRFALPIVPPAPDIPLTAQTPLMKIA